MDDIGKAIIMSVQVLMFVLASTVAVFLYNKLTNNADEIFLASNFSNQEDSISDIELADSTRDATQAEVIMAILDLKKKCEKLGNDDSVVIVRVNMSEYILRYEKDTDELICSAGTSTSFNSSRSAILAYVPEANYRLTYNDDGITLKYTRK